MKKSKCEIQNDTNLETHKICRSMQKWILAVMIGLIHIHQYLIKVNSDKTFTLAGEGKASDHEVEISHCGILSSWNYRTTYLC